jgi:Flp pilus assembly protein TadG
MRIRNRSMGNGRRTPPRAAERGQALIEFVVFSFFAVLIGMAACEGGKYCLAQASAEQACTAACREISQGYSEDASYDPSDSVTKAEIDAVVRKAAPNVVGDVQWSDSGLILQGKDNSTGGERYTHHLSDSDGNASTRTSYVYYGEDTVTVKVKCSYISSIGKLLCALGTGSDGTYTVTSTHDMQVDATLHSSGKSGKNGW